MTTKDKLLNILKIVVAVTIFTAALLNYKTLSNLDIRLLIAGASTVLTAELIILGVYIVKSILFVLPASLIYISVGMAFDWKRAVIINILGIALEVTISFFLGKFLGKEEVEKRLSNTKFGSKLINMQNKNRNLAVFLIRLLPVFPIDFSSLFMGAFGFSFPFYFLFSMLGLAPRVIGFTIVGEGIYEIIPVKHILLAVIVLLPVAVIAGIIKKRISKQSNISAEI